MVLVPSAMGEEEHPRLSSSSCKSFSSNLKFYASPLLLKSAVLRSWISLF